MNQADLGVVRAVFEDLGGVQAVAREQGEGPLVSHLQRTNIQLAAIPVFVRKGLADTTVNDLLEAAQVSRRTFYKYFANKMDVLEGIYCTAVALLLARFRELQPGADMESWLRAMVGLFFDYHLSVGPIIRLMQEEALRGDSPLAVHRQQAHAEMQALLQQRLALSGKEFPALTYQALIWAMESASLNLLSRAALRQEIGEAKTVLGDLLLAVLCPRTT